MAAFTPLAASKCSRSSGLLIEITFADWASTNDVRIRDVAGTASTEQPTDVLADLRIQRFARHTR